VLPFIQRVDALDASEAPKIRISRVNNAA
jgi:hypothetical protein